MNKYSYNVNKNTIEKYGQFFAYVNVIDVNRIVKLLNEQDKQIAELKNNYKIINTYKSYEKKYKKRIKELKKENEKLKQRIEEETDRVIKLEQYVYTKLCPKSEYYDEKVLSEIINTILGDLE